jgi:hypothetical protein
MKDLIREVGRTVRAALESWPMTARLCVLIATGSVAAVAFAVATYYYQH